MENHCTYRRTKMARGIPMSQCVLSDRNTPGAMLTRQGYYVVPKVNAEAYLLGKKEAPPFVKVVAPEPVAVKIPEELLCTICNKLIEEAVLINCCGNSFCQTCITELLLESEEGECPACYKTEMFPSNLVSNHFMRGAVQRYLSGRYKPFRIQAPPTQRAPKRPEVAVSV